MPKLTDQIRQCVDLLHAGGEADERGDITNPIYRCLINLADVERLLAEYEVEQLPEIINFDPCRVRLQAQESGLPSIIFGRDHYVELPRLVALKASSDFAAEADALHGKKR